MTDGTDEVTAARQAQQSKNPIDNAANKLREALGKEAQKKLEDQLKRLESSWKIAQNEKAEFKRLQAEIEQDKASLKAFLGDVLT